jgi:hypothetical protein
VFYILLLLRHLARLDTWEREKLTTFLLFIAPYTFVAGVSLLPLGAAWDACLCGLSVLLLLSAVLAHCNESKIAGPYSCGWVLYLALQWVGCLAGVAVAGIAQLLSR